MESFAVFWGRFACVCPLVLKSLRSTRSYSEGPVLYAYTPSSIPTYQLHLPGTTCTIFLVLHAYTPYSIPTSHLGTNCTACYLRVNSDKLPSLSWFNLYRPRLVRLHPLVNYDKLPLPFWYKLYHSQSFTLTPQSQLGHTTSTFLVQIVPPS